MKVIINKPYVATYSTNDVLVLVTGPGKTPGKKSGIMINGNLVYQPFEYVSDIWDEKCLKPFRGAITIECP